jgi:hypothetical protein
MLSTATIQAGRGEEDRGMGARQAHGPRNWDLLALTAILFLANAWMFQRTFLPIHDSLASFQVFHFIYSDWLFHGEFAEWLPYCSFGMQSDYWALVSISPAEYLMMGIGRLLGCLDCMLLFKVSVFLEELAFVFGIYVLARQLFQRRSTIWFVCLGAIFSQDWQTQIWWNLRIFYLVPLALALLLLFIKRRRWSYLWLAGVVFVASLIGNLAYFAPLYVFVSCVFLVSLAWRERPAWRDFLHFTRWDAACLILFLSFAFVYLRVAWHVLDQLAYTLNTGRMETTGATTLYSFLAYGNHPTLGELVQQVLTGWPVRGSWTYWPDLTFYIGLLPLALLPWAAAGWREPRCFAFLALALLLVWLSGGGAFAMLAYLFPTLWWFRHLGALYPLIKIIILLCAGFGFERFLGAARRWHLWLAIFLCVFGADLLANYHYLPLPNGAFPGGEATRPAWAALFGLRVGLYIAGCTWILYHEWRQQDRHVGEPEQKHRIGSIGFLRAVMLGCYVADLILFQMEVYIVSPKPEYAPGQLESLAAAPFSYQSERTLEPRRERGQAGLQLMDWVLHHQAHVYQTAEGYLQWDSCGSRYYTPHMVDGVYALIKVVPDRPHFFYDLDGLDGYEAQLNDKPNVIFGCQAPKIRLVPRAVYAADEAGVLETSRTVDPAQFVALQGTPTQELDANPPGRLAEALGNIRVTDFSANAISLNVTVNAPSAWLVYADAYHPEWRATVNGQGVHVLPAYHAFKAIRLEHGQNAVRFQFRSGLTANRLLGICGAAFWVALLLTIGFALVRGQESLPAGRPEEYRPDQSNEQSMPEPGQPGNSAAGSGQADSARENTVDQVQSTEMESKVE